MRRCLMLLSLSLVGMASGCRCCGIINPYANLIDDVSDVHIHFDNWYYPRLDISRAGRPDWCGPINRRLCPNICYFGCYDRYSDEYLYPPSNPYWFPGDALYDGMIARPSTLAGPLEELPPEPAPTPSPEISPPPPAPMPLE